MSCINIAHNTNICCTISWSCQTTFICSLRLDTKSALNVQFNSLKADSHSAREGNSGSRHPFGNVVFQRYGFMARKLSHAFGNISRRLVQRPAEYAYSSSNARFELDEVPQGLKPTGDLPLVGTSEDVP